jgi:hypothetical protein
MTLMEKLFYTNAILTVGGFWLTLAFEAVDLEIPFIAAGTVFFVSLVAYPALLVLRIWGVL